MNYYNFNPNITDSLLDFEGQSVPTKYNGWRGRIDSFECKGPGIVWNSVKLNTLYDGFLNRPPPQNSSPINQEKSRDFQITQQYTQANFENRGKKNYNRKRTSHSTNPKHPRPIIKVIVIPKNSSYSNLHKPRTKSKKLQTTFSDQDTSIKLSNVRSAPGHQKRGNLSVRSGSEFSSTHSPRKNEEFVECNLKSLLESMEMDKKKKKKGKKEKVSLDTDNISLMDVLEASDSAKLTILKECFCSGESTDDNPRKNRVRVSGRIGRTHDDRYVLNCNATIAGKSVEAKGFEVTRCSQSCPGKNAERDEAYQNTKCPGGELCRMERQKEAYAQANIPPEESYVTCPAFSNPRSMSGKLCPAYSKPCPALQSVGTQCGQSNLNAICFSNIETLKIVSAARDDLVHCESPDCNFNVTNIGVGRTDKSISSPLVIISVYPKSTEKMSSGKIPTAGEPDTSMVKAVKSKEGKKGKKKEGGGSAARSRSPSPTKLSSKIKPAKSPKNKQEIGGKQSKGKTDTDERGKNVVKKEKGGRGATRKESRSPSPDKHSLKSGHRNSSIDRTSFERGKCTECCIGCDGVNRQEHKGEQTRSRSQIKRMMNWVSAKDHDSNVAININGENEFYDVVFKQGGMTTDVRVRKTKVKDTPLIQDGETDSLENFLLPTVHLEERKRSFSQTYLPFPSPPIDGSANTRDEPPPLAPIKVRDSIEISHRREEKTSLASLKCMPSDYSTSSSNALSFEFRVGEASAKHFKGDKCKLPNPIARDKEIRELLGIEKPRFSKGSQAPKLFVQNVETLVCSQMSQHNKGNQINDAANASTNTNTVNDINLQTTDDQKENYVINKADKLKEEKYGNYDYKTEVNVAHEITICHQISQTSTPKDTLGACESRCTHLKRDDKRKKEPYVAYDYKARINAAHENTTCHKISQTFSTPKYSISSCESGCTCPNKDRKRKEKAFVTYDHKIGVNVGHEITNCHQISQTSNPKDLYDCESGCTCPYSKSHPITRNESDCFNNIVRRNKFESTSVNNCDILWLKAIHQKEGYQQTRTITEKKLQQLSGHQHQPDNTRVKVTHANNCIQQRKECNSQGLTEKFRCRHKSVRHHSNTLRTGKTPKKGADENVVENFCQLQTVPQSSQTIKDNTDAEVQTQQFIPKNDTSKQPIILQNSLYASLAKSVHKTCYQNIQKQNNYSQLISKTIRHCKVPQEFKNKCEIEDTSHIPKENLNNKNNQQRNINICLQLDNLSKNKPIAITRNQYAKMRKLIENTKPKKKYFITKRSSVTIGEIRIKRTAKVPPPVITRGIQSPKNKEFMSPRKKLKNNQATNKIIQSYNTEVKWCKKSEAKRKRHGQGDEELDQTEKQKMLTDSDETPCIVYYMNTGKDHKKDTRYSSSTEICYKNIKYNQYMSCSSTNVRQRGEKPKLVGNILQKRSTDSIFKGRRKSPTPNLGTSAYSLYSEYVDANSKSKFELPDQRPRKPLLRRLMSRLVMRYKISDTKILNPPVKPLPLNNSADWYYINTSVEAMEVSSSIYDTTASFYSSHSIHPVNSKIKRGFLNSFRGLLPSRRN